MTTVDLGLRALRDMNPTRWALVIVLVVAAAAFPLMSTDQYLIRVVTAAFILLLVNISWNFVLGVAGVWNFAVLAIYAIGAYGAGLLLLHTALPAPLSVVAGGVLAGGVSLLLAIPTLRLAGIYTALLTFSFAQVVQFLAQNDPAGSTGGTFGFPSVEGLFAGLSPPAALRAHYWTALGAVVLASLGVGLIINSRFGMGLMTIRDAPAYAAARGLNLMTYRLSAFALSGFVAGVAGALFVSFNHSITPNAMGLGPMSVAVSMLVIGGLGTVFGPVLGTSLLVIVSTWLMDYPGRQFTVIGIMLLVFVMFLPSGLVGTIAELRRRLHDWVTAGDG